MNHWKHTVTILALVLGIGPVAMAQHSPYADERASDIKALTADEHAALLAHAGTGGREAEADAAGVAVARALQSVERLEHLL